MRRSRKSLNDKTRGVAKVGKDRAMGDDDKSKSAIRRLVDYSEDALNGFENRRVRRTVDVVDEIEADREFLVKFRTRVRAWAIMTGLAAATLTAALTLKGQLRLAIMWLLGDGA